MPTSVQGSVALQNCGVEPLGSQAQKSQPSHTDAKQVHELHQDSQCSPASTARVKAQSEQAERVVVCALHQLEHALTPCISAATRIDKDIMRDP